MGAAEEPGREMRGGVGFLRGYSWKELSGSEENREVGKAGRMSVVPA